MEIGLVIRVVVWIFAALVVVGATVFLVSEAMDKVESIQKRAPWIPKILERRDAFVALLLIAVVLLIGDGYELLTKEVPESSLPTIVFKAPTVPMICAPTEKNPSASVGDALGAQLGRIFPNQRARIAIDAVHFVRTEMKIAGMDKMTLVPFPFTGTPIETQIFYENRGRWMRSILSMRI
jgi:hypothetical protein